MRKQTDRASKNEEEFPISVAVGVLVLILLGLGLLYWAGSYPVVWRYSMLMNAPHSLVIASVFCVIGISAAIGSWSQNQNRISAGCETAGAGYLVGAIFLILCFTQLGIVLNGSLDRNPPQVFQTSVISKRVSHSSKGGTQWHINVTDWHAPNSPIQLTVPRDQYNVSAIGSSMQVTTKPGFLGYEWVVSYSQTISRSSTRRYDRNVIQPQFMRS